MKCTNCNWVCITDIEKPLDWEKLDIANWAKSRHVSNLQHEVIIKQETVYNIKRQ